jgi:hypothetical protein
LTVRRIAPIIPTMPLGWRTVLAGLLTPALISTGIAPTLHAHEADAHHPHTVVHRHTHLHAGGHTAGDIHIAGDGNVSDSDEDAVWINAQSVERSRIRVDTCSAILCRTLSFTLAPKGASLLVSADDSLPHGPPVACASTRGPPYPTV